MVLEVFICEMKNLAVDLIELHSHSLKHDETDERGHESN